MVAYFLSLLVSDSEIIPMEDNFPNENIFVIYTNFPWYADIVHHLVADQFPNHLSP